MRRIVTTAATLLEFLAAMYPDSSKTTLRQLLQSGRVRVNHEVENNAKQQLEPGDGVEVLAKSDERSLPEGLAILHEDTDVIVVGAGLAGLAAAAELADAGRRVLLLDQEPESSLGGQAFWSLGGLFLVDTPEQRLMGVRDSVDLAMQDWFGSAQFDRPEDYWPRRWAEAYVHFAAGEKRSWLRGHGIDLLPKELPAFARVEITDAHPYDLVGGIIAAA